MRLKTKYLMSYSDIQTLSQSTIQYLLQNYPDWTRYGLTQITHEGTIQHTSWLYEYVTDDNTHKLTIQHHKDTDTYDTSIVGPSWIESYQGFANFKYERLAIVYILKAILEIDIRISRLNIDQVDILCKIIEGHLNEEHWSISKLYL